MPETKLVALTQGVNGEDVGELLTKAFSQCYQKEANLDVVIRHMKHMSVLEHVSFTFEQSCTRVCWEQLVRHRLASFTAQSHRYTDIELNDYLEFIPSEVLDMGEMMVQEWKEDLKNNHKIYKKWRERGVTKQTARYQASKGIKIKATVTFNLRSLINLLSLRTDSSAQEEIQILAKLTWDELKPYIPEKLYDNIQQNYFSRVSEIKGNL